MKYKRQKGGVKRKSRLKAGERGHREEEIRGRKERAEGKRLEGEVSRESLEEV